MNYVYSERPFLKLIAYIYLNKVFGKRFEKFIALLYNLLSIWFLSPPIGVFPSLFCFSNSNAYVEVLFIAAIVYLRKIEKCVTFFLFKVAAAHRVLSQTD